MLNAKKIKHNLEARTSTPKKLDFEFDTDEMLVAEKIENLSLVDLDVIDIDMQDSTDLLNEITAYSA